jgi:hypothetical protein
MPGPDVPQEAAELLRSASRLLRSASQPLRRAGLARRRALSVADLLGAEQALAEVIQGPGQQA